MEAEAEARIPAATEPWGPWALAAAVAQAGGTRMGGRAAPEAAGPYGSFLGRKWVTYALGVYLHWPGFCNYHIS